MPFNWSPLWLSLRVAGVATGGALVPGLWLAWLLATREFAGRKAATGALALLLALPVVILARTLLGPELPWQAGAAAGVAARFLAGTESRLRAHGTLARRLRVANLLACDAAPGLASHPRCRGRGLCARAGGVGHRGRAMTRARVARKAGGLSLDLDLPLPVGITALVGPPGSGKSLLLEIVAGFSAPDSGRILVDDAIVFDAASGVNLPARRRRCVWVGARESLFPNMTVRENLMFAAFRWPRLERHKRAAEMLERFELAAALEMRPCEIAPATRLRAEIARALIAEPKMLLIDERGADESLLRLLRATFEAPVLLVTDDLDLCYSTAGQVALLEAGRIVQRGAARDTIENPESLEAARLLGIANLFSATIAGLDPGRNHSRLECEAFVLSAPYLKCRLKGDQVSVGIRAEDVRVHSGELEGDVNFVPANLLRISERPRAVRLEFAGGIAAQLSREQFERQKDNRSWQVEFPPAALRVF